MSEVTYFILYILQHNKGRHQPFWSDPLNPIFRLSLIFPSGDAPFSPYAGVTLACAGRGRIPVELLQVLKDDAVKVLHSICQRIWKTQQWPQDWKRSVFIPIPKKGNAKESSNYRTIALISHASKVKVKVKSLSGV